MKDFMQDYAYRVKEVAGVFLGLGILLVPPFAIGGLPVWIAIWRGNCWWLFLLFASLPAAIPYPAFMLARYSNLGGRVG